jgi:hypothetical protein
MIRIKEEKLDLDQPEKIFLKIDNNSEIIYDSYPIVIKPPYMDHQIYKASVLEKKMKRW